jgi:UDP-galactopyranose mutase
MSYDYLIVGSGFFGATFARLVTDLGKKCLIIESRNHIGGNAYTEKRNDIDVHVYGPHIFHTNNEKIWKFVNQFTKFNNFILSPKSYRNGKIYSLPFNMNTFYEIWGTITPKQAQEKIQSQMFLGEPKNLEEQALKLVGKDIYDLLIKDYTIKQWKKNPKELPAFIIKRLPLRFTYDNNYFDDNYQGIPVYGYTKLFENMLHDIEVKLNTNYFDNTNYWNNIAKKIVYTGKIDEFFNYEFGELEYRSLRFEHQELEIENYQGNAVINYPELQYDWTRIVEHKHFTKVQTKNTIITKEYPTNWNKNEQPYYPINDEKNTKIYEKYRDKSLSIKDKFIFGGRLSEYRYYDMHQVIGSAMKQVEVLKDEI